MPLPRERHLDCDAKRIWHGMSKAKAKRSLPEEATSSPSSTSMFDVQCWMFDVHPPNNPQQITSNSLPLCVPWRPLRLGGKSSICIGAARPRRPTGTENPLSILNSDSSKAPQPIRKAQSPPPTASTPKPPSISNCASPCRWCKAWSSTGCGRG